MKKKRTKKNKILNLKRLLLFIFLIILVCLMIHPIQLITSNLFKPLSIAAGANNSRPNRYSQVNGEKTTYTDASGKEYYIEFVQNLREEILLSYEDIIQHKAEVVNKDNYGESEMKDLFIAEMKNVISKNYIERYKNSPKYDSTKDIPDDVLEIAKNDSTITKNENTRLSELWDILNFGTYQTIIQQETIGNNRQSLFDIGKIYATTRTLNLYKRNPNLLTVENGGITPGEAYIMASNRNQSTSFDTDKNQQALWVINDKGLEINSTEEIPNTYKGLNPEANVVGSNVESEATALQEHNKKVEEFKKDKVVDGVETEIYDNMLKIYDTKNNKNYYESGMAGLVGYDEGKEEYLVGPFSVDYVRTVFNPLEGGQNENQNEEGIIIFNSIIDAEVYGLNANGEEVKLSNWEFIYPDVEYDLKTKVATRIAETNAINSGDKTKNIYPYPNENFYIRFKDSSIQAITKIEFKTKSMNAEAEVYLYEGKTYDISWVGATSGGENYLQMTPSWDEINNGKAEGIDVADLYQIKSARLVNEEKIITLSVGYYHEKYNNYCIPITMELGGTVWYDGTEIEAVQDSNKVFGIRDKNDKDEYSERGIENIYVHLYDENDNRIASTVTDKNGNYLFTYVKLGPKYYIEFEYDGMKYKATTYLNGDLDNETYRNSNEFLNYLDYSHAKEDVTERTEYNNSFTEIKNGNTRTTGQAISDTGVIKDISYTTQNFDGSNATYIGGTADIDRYNFATRTKTTQLLYPLQDSYMITGKYISEVDQNQNHLVELGIPNIFALGRINLAKNETYVVNTKQGEENAEIVDKDNFYTEETISYTMVDTYLHHINLGLVERAPIDFAVKNDVVKVSLTYQTDIVDENPWDYGTKSLDINSFDITSREGNYYDISNNYQYEIGYINYIETIHNYEPGQSVETIENDMFQTYVQYKMTIRNQAEVTSGYITELVNYYENSLYYPVDSNESWRYYDKNINYVYEREENGGVGYGNIIIPQVAPMTSWAIKNAGTNNETNLGQVNWNSNSIFGSSNNKDYSNNGLRTMYTNSLSNELLKPGETIDIYVIYKVEVKEDSTIGPGKYMINDNTGVGKRNIVEINAYKALNIDGTNGGRVDKDSAPGNIELENYVTYEDDVDMAPYFKLITNGDLRGNIIEGYVWEDLVDEISKLGDGVLSESERINNYINNVIVELVKLEYNQDTGEYEEVTFSDAYREAFPDSYKWLYQYTDDTIQSILGTDNKNALISWTGPNSNNSNSVRTLENGQYRFENLVTGGKYKVRFIYGTEPELRAESINSNIVGSKDKKMHTGHDYKSTEYTGRMIYDENNKLDFSGINSASMPTTDVIFVIDSYEMIKDSNSSKEIINILKNLYNDISINNNGSIKTQIISYGAENYKECSNFDEILSGSTGNTAFSAVEAIYTAGLKLKEGSAQNKIMVIYNDGSESKLEDTKAQIAQLLNDGVTVIGIGNGTQSLDMYRVKPISINNNNVNKIQVYTLNDNDGSKEYIINNLYDDIANKIINSYYLLPNTSHAEDYIQDETYYTMNDVQRSVNGRLQVMQYSQTMNAERADALNIEYINTLEKNGEEWSTAIKTLANNTQMTADSYIVSFDGIYDENKTINFGLQEIPERDVEITNEVDSIVVRLSTGRPIVNWRYNQEHPAENVQIIEQIKKEKDGLFSIYMDKEIMQGATIEVTYRIHISNIGEVDKLINYVRYATPEEQRNWYNALTGENISIDEIQSLNGPLYETIPIKISKIYSYFDNLVFRAEDNNKWEIINKNVATNDNGELVRENGYLVYDGEDGNIFESGDLGIPNDGREQIANGNVIWTKVDTESNDKDAQDYLAILDRNKDRIGKYSVVQTTSLKDIELYPNKSVEVRDSEHSGKYSTLATYLVLSKTLSAEDMQAEDALSYRNYVEIIETSSITGRRDYNGAEGNFTGDGTLNNLTSENDIDNAERVIILPPFGDKKIMIAVIISVLVILGVGIIFIKKKVV